MRGKQMAYVPQNPMAALNPLFTIEWQLREALSSHVKIAKREAQDRIVDALDVAGIPDARSQMHRYPHEFSGGMRQRVLIAMAILNTPDVAAGRRADDRSRHDHAGEGSRPAGWAGRALRHGDLAHHPQHGRRRGHVRAGDRDVRRPGRRDRHRCCGVSRSAAPLQPAAPRCHAATRGEDELGWSSAETVVAAADREAVGLRVSFSLSVGGGAVRERSRASGGRTGAIGSMLGDTTRLQDPARVSGSVQTDPRNPSARRRGGVAAQRPGRQEVLPCPGGASGSGGDDLRRRRSVVRPEPGRDPGPRGRIGLR